ncbi:unannotated protein [freshwater metagenome]|uniref:Unannotated protein n=1 Tax=freshwater metagenome TaxID=449393 RepID=A0A6J6V0Q1_9ZZZZ
MRGSAGFDRTHQFVRHGYQPRGQGDGRTEEPTRHAATIPPFALVTNRVGERVTTGGAVDEEGAEHGCGDRAVGRGPCVGHERCHFGQERTAQRCSMVDWRQCQSGGRIVDDGRAVRRAAGECGVVQFEGAAECDDRGAGGRVEWLRSGGRRVGSQRGVRAEGGLHRPDLLAFTPTRRGSRALSIASRHREGVKLHRETSCALNLAPAAGLATEGVRPIALRR